MNNVPVNNQVLMMYFRQRLSQEGLVMFVPPFTFRSVYEIEQYISAIKSYYRASGIRPVPSFESTGRWTVNVA